ncbi:MAG: MOSC domain-containing protein [Phycisphaerales bacterium]|nr:MOSC domain-containing protein [Phycisphaerales bacterium]
MAEEIVGKVLSIALRSEDNGPMQEVTEVDAAEDGGLSGDVSSSPDRGITFLASEQWGEVTRELGVEIPWHTRRANVLVEANRLGSLIGRTVSVGDIQVKINAETKPCGLMDKLQAGLKDVLKPDCRAGVYGRIIRGGKLRVGDVVKAHA